MRHFRRWMYLSLALLGLTANGVANGLLSRSFVD